MTRRVRSLYVRGFPDEMFDLMAREIARSRKEGGRLRSYRDVLVAALVRYGEDQLQRQQKELEHALRRMGQ